MFLFNGSSVTSVSLIEGKDVSLRQENPFFFCCPFFLYKELLRITLHVKKINYLSRKHFK